MVYTISDKTIVYSEVYAVINELGEEYINKIPKKLLEIIENNRNHLYNPVYNMKNKLTEQKISKEAISMIYLIHSSYWCANEEEKKAMKTIIVENTKKKQEEMEKMYPTDVFAKEKNDVANKITWTQEDEIQTQEDKNNNAIMVVKEKWYHKILNKLKNIFRKNSK